MIGAGPAGLVTTKELLDEGHQPVCFERAAGLGGVFRFGEDDGRVWESCRLTSSPLLTSFSDFPAPAEKLLHMSAAEYVAYLNHYCDAFDVHRYLRFGHDVESVARDPDGSWVVRTRSAAGTAEGRFDAVAICTGLHQHPHVPVFSGQDTYTGTILHGAYYRQKTRSPGNVFSSSARENRAPTSPPKSRPMLLKPSCRFDAALPCRRASSWASRRICQTSRLMNSAAHWIFQTRNPADDHKRTVYRWTFLPFLLVDKALQQTSRFLFDYLPQFRARDLGAIRENLLTRQLMMRLLRESGGTFNEQFGTKTTGSSVRS